MIRGDLFRLEKQIIKKISKIYNKYCNNFKFRAFFYLKTWCLNPEKSYLRRIKEEIDYEWQHTTNFLAKTLNNEV